MKISSAGVSRERRALVAGGLPYVFYVSEVWSDDLPSTIQTTDDIVTTTYCTVLRG